MASHGLSEAVWVALVDRALRDGAEWPWSPPISPGRLDVRGSRGRSVGSTMGFSTALTACR